MQHATETINQSEFTSVKAAPCSFGNIPYFMHKRGLIHFFLFLYVVTWCVSFARDLQLEIFHLHWSVASIYIDYRSIVMQLTERL